MSCWECCTSIRMAKVARPGGPRKWFIAKGKEWLRPRPAKRAGAANQLGCAGNRQRSRRGPRCRVRTGSGLCGSRLSPQECAAPEGGIAETVSGGHGPRGRRADDGRRSGRQRAGRALYRTRTGSTIRDVIRWAIGQKMKSDERRRIASFRDNWPHEGVLRPAAAGPPFATASGRRALPECLPDPRKQPVLLDPFGIRAIVGVAHQVALFRLRPRVVDQVDRDGAQCMADLPAERLDERHRHHPVRQVLRDVRRMLREAVRLM